MSYILLHNICIRFGDPCEPRWRLNVQQLDLFPRRRPRNENPNIASSTNWKLETDFGNNSTKHFLKRCLIIVKGLIFMLCSLMIHVSLDVVSRDASHWEVFHRTDFSSSQLWSKALKIPVKVFLFQLALTLTLLRIFFKDFSHSCRLATI